MFLAVLVLFTLTFVLMLALALAGRLKSAKWGLLFSFASLIFGQLGRQQASDLLLVTALLGMLGSLAWVAWQWSGANG